MKASEGKLLAMRNLAFWNKVTNEVLQVSIEGDFEPVVLMFHRISRAVLKSEDWERMEAVGKVE